MRFDSRQELYALNVGAKSWQDFEAEIQAEAVGQEFEVAKLGDLKLLPNCLGLNLSLEVLPRLCTDVERVQFLPRIEPHGVWQATQST